MIVKKMLAMGVCLAMMLSLTACVQKTTASDEEQTSSWDSETGVAGQYETGLGMGSSCWNPHCIDTDCDDWDCDVGTCTNPDCRNPDCDGDDCLAQEHRDVRICTNPNCKDLECDSWDCDDRICTNPNCKDPDCNDGDCDAGANKDHHGKDGHGHHRVHN